MLGSYPVDVMLLATDLSVARRFYSETLGLEVLLEDEQSGDPGLLAGGRHRRRSRRAQRARRRDPGGPRAEHRRRRRRLGFALAAWFVDPHQNWIGLLQLKSPRSA
jgi:catechol 2,3-dioxygenase-like lactoylglutathione lyase family enzyme